MVQRAHPAAATALDPTAMPRGKKAAAAPPASCELGQVASLKGLRWARKAAEEARPAPRADVLMLLPKPGKPPGEKGDAKLAWLDGEAVHRAAEDKASAKALRDAKRDAKRAVRAERGAEKLGRQAGKGGAKDAGGGLRRRAAGELLTAAATYEAVGTALRAAHATHVFATLPAAGASGGASGGAGKSGAAAAAELLATFEARRAAHLVRADALAREAWADAPPPASPRASPRAPGELARAWCAAPVESPRSPRLEFQAPDLARASS